MSYNGTTDPKILKAEKTGLTWLGQIVADIKNLEKRHEEDEPTKEDIDSDRATEDRYEKEMFE